MCSVGPLLLHQKRVINKDCVPVHYVNDVFSVPPSSSSNSTCAPAALQCGVLVWELLSHARPFDVLTQREVVLVVNVGRRPKFPEGTPKQLVAVVERCWDQTAKKRPAFKAVVSWLDELIRNYEELLVNAAAAARGGAAAAAAGDSAAAEPALHQPAGGEAVAKSSSSS